MKKRAIVSISLLVSLIFIVVSGVSMYLGNHDYYITSLHHIFSILFILMAFFHFFFNRKAIENHAIKKKKKIKVSNSLFMVSLAMLLFCLGVFYKFPLFEKIYNISASYAASSKNKDDRTFINFIKVDKNQEGKGEVLEFTFKKGPYFKWPQYAIWIEDIQGNYIQTVFVTGKIANDKFTTIASYDSLGKLHFKGSKATAHLRSRPESLPVWLHKYKKYSEMQYDVPKSEFVIPDAFSGATMKSDFILNTKSINTLPEEFVVNMEINQSFDWNTYYTKDKFPDDLTYSGNGFSAQPSIIYSAVISKKDNNSKVFLEPIGRSHHSGKHGDVIKDISKITTALELIDWVLIDCGG